MTVGIIGAGPAGSFLGARLTWDDAIIFERNPKIGHPIQCTGIVTDSIYRNIDSLPDDVVMNYIDTFRIKSPEGASIDVKLDKRNIILDRGAFDRHMADLAMEKGVPIKLKHSLTGWKTLSDGKFRLAFSNGHMQDVDYLVGADGPNSTVARHAGIYGKREILIGMQSRVKIKQKGQEFDPHVTDVYFGLGEFAWLVPESKTHARVGVIGKSSPNLRQDYLKLIKPYETLENQSGVIPLYNPKQVMQKGKLALIGDAATQVKATTYGGIIYGMISANYIGEKWDDYEKRFKAKLGKDLWISLKMRETLNKLSEEECNDLVKIFEKKESKSILEKSDRNFPSKFILQLLLKETKLWKYGFKIFK